MEMDPNVLVDYDTLAQILGVSQTTIRRYQKRGVIRRHGTRKGDSGFRLGPSVRAYLDARLKGAGEDGPVESLKDQIDAEKLRKLQMETARANRELLPVSLLEDYARQVGSVVNDGLEALAGNIRKRIPHLRAGEITQIKAEIHKTARAIVDADFAPH